MNETVPEAPAPEPDIGANAASGVLWLTLQKWAIRIAGLVTIGILTRLLTPEAFGVVAAASAVLPFFYLLSDLGFAMYIVQADRASQQTLSTGFWFSASAGVLLAAVLVAGAPLLGDLFRSDDLVPVVRVLAIAVILTAIASVPMALLRRRMKFAALATQGVIASLVGQVVAIAIAFSGLGVWALVGQTLASQFVIAVLASISARWLPTLTFSKAEFHAMTRFGSKVLGVEMVAMIRAAGEAAIVSASLGLTAFGYLTIAQRIVQIVQDLTGAALLPVTTVAFAKIRQSPERLLAAYVRALRMTYVLMAPPLVLLSVAAPLIVPLVFGDGWGPSVPVTQFLALAGTVVVGATLDHGLFYGLGRPGRWFAYAFAVDLLTISVTAVAVHWGLVPVAVGFLVVALLATTARWFVVARLLQASPRQIVGPFVFLIVTVPACLVAGTSVLSLVDSLPALLGIVLVGLAVLITHLFVVRMLARSAFSDAREYLGRLGLSKRFRVRLGGKPR